MKKGGQKKGKRYKQNKTCKVAKILRIIVVQEDSMSGSYVL